MEASGHVHWVWLWKWWNQRAILRPWVHPSSLGLRHYESLEGSLVVETQFQGLTTFPALCDLDTSTLFFLNLFLISKVWDMSLFHKEEQQAGGME